MIESYNQGSASGRPGCPEIIELAVVSDAAYIEPIGVMLYSILRWHDPATLRLHWVHVRMDRQALRTAEDLCGTANIKVNLVAGDSLIADAGWPTDVNPTLLKIFLPELLADFGDRILYLDGDLVVEAQLWPLWRTDFRGAALVGVRDSWVGSSGFWFHFSGSDAEVSCALWMRQDYINAGVLMYDMARCRALDITAQCKKWLTHSPRASFLEQDALNVAAAGAITLAPPAWNVHGVAHSYVLPPQPHTPYLTSDLQEAYRHPNIVHFAGLPKPWDDDTHWQPLFPRYFRARRISPWHRRLTVAEQFRLAALDTTHRLQCHGFFRVARAMLYAVGGGR